MRNLISAVNHGPSPSKQAGMSMIEVLVAIVVISLGLLGLAGLQATSLKNNYSAHTRAQAMQYAQDMLDRMRANRAAALNGNYDLVMTAAAPACNNAVTCDLSEWMADIATLPAGDACVSLATATDDLCFVPNAGSNADDACDGVANGNAVVVVRWDDSRSGGAGAIGYSCLESEL